MNRTAPAAPPPESWRLPIAVGATATFVLHLPALFNNLWWVSVVGTCGCSGAPTGLLATLLALRKDPGMGPASGFALAFIAAGAGILLAVAGTVLTGFEIAPADYEMLRQSLLASGESAAKVAERLGQLQDHGATSVVVAGGMVALGSGLTGGAAAAFRLRRLRGASAAPRPPAPPPA